MRTSIQMALNPEVGDMWEVTSRSLKSSLASWDTGVRVMNMANTSRDSYKLYSIRDTHAHSGGRNGIFDFYSPLRSNAEKQMTLCKIQIYLMAHKSMSNETYRAFLELGI